MGGHFADDAPNLVAMRVPAAHAEPAPLEAIIAVVHELPEQVTASLSAPKAL